MSVPVVNLLDPAVEPTDEELAALTRSMMVNVIKRRKAAERRFWSEIFEGGRKGATERDPAVLDSERWQGLEP